MHPWWFSLMAGAPMWGQREEDPAGGGTYFEVKGDWDMPTVVSDTTKYLILMKTRCG